MEAEIRKVLILDDEPLHLEICSSLVEMANFQPIPVLVEFSGPVFPLDPDIALIILDYRLNSSRTAPELAHEAQSRYPGAPVIVLSDLWWLPSDIAPYAAKFVRKGEPQKLIDTIQNLMVNSSGTQA